MRQYLNPRSLKKLPWWFWILLIAIPLFFFAFKPGRHVSAFGLNADFAIGQPDTSSGNSNAGGSVGPSGFDYQDGLATDGTHVFVSDCSNNRVLVYNHVPTTSGAQADFVIGQPDMTSSLANQGKDGFPTDSTTMLKSSIATYWNFSDPGTVFTNLTLSNTSPDGTFTGTSVVAGKIGNARSYNGTTDSGLSNFWDVPSGASVRSVFVWIKPASNGETGAVISEGVAVAGREATLGLLGGKVNFTSFGTNITGSTSLAAGNWYLIGYTYDGLGDLRLYVNGVLDGGPTAIALNTQSTGTGFGFDRAQSNNYFSGTIDDAGVWLGILDSTALSELYNSGNGETYSNGVGANTMNCPTYLATDGTRLFVSDSGNNRVLVFNPFPNINNASADLVIGQSTMTQNFKNKEGSATSSTLNYPVGVSYDSDSRRLLITDSGNNRVLIYNSAPTQNDTPATIVVGQPDMASASANQGNLTPSSSTLSNPYSAQIFQNKLLVADASNNRVLIYDSVPSINGVSADHVIGQPDTNSGDNNQGGSTSGQTLSFPTDTLWDGSRLLVADDGNNRILIYNSIPTSDNVSATDAIGQTDLLGSGFGTTSDTISDPEGQLAQAGTTLLVGDSSNSRVLGYNNFLQAPTVTSPNPSEFANQSFLHTDTSGTKAVLTMLEVGSTLYVGGIFSRICDTNELTCVSRNGLAAIDENTGQVTSWDLQLSNSIAVEVDSIVEANGIIYVSGFFNQAQGNSRGNIAAFDANTGVLLPFAPIANDGVISLATDSSNLYVGGYFSSIDGNTRHGLASFDISTDSGHLTAWSPPSDDSGVLKVQVYNNVLYVGGYFNSIGCYESGLCPAQGVNRKLLAAFYATQSANYLTDFDQNLNTSGGFSSFSSVQAMAFCANNFYFGGNFTGVNGQPRDDLAAVDLTNNTLLSFAPNPGPRGPVDYASGTMNNNREVFSLSVFDNNLYVGGDYSDINGLHQQGVSSFSLATDAGQLNSWNPKVGHYGIIDTIYPTQNHIYIGGDFSVEGLTGAIGATTSAKNLAQFDYVSSGATNVCALSTPSPTPTVTLTLIDSPTPTPTDTPSSGGSTPYVCKDTKPGTPSNMQLKAGPGVGQVTVSWTAPSGPVTDYSLTYSTDINKRMWGVASTGNVTTYVVSDLPVNQNYYFWVNAVNGCMPGDAIDPEIHLGSTVASSYVISTNNQAPALGGSTTGIPAPSPLPPTGPSEVIKFELFGILLTIIAGAALLLL